MKKIIFLDKKMIFFYEKIEKLQNTLEYKAWML